MKIGNLIIVASLILGLISCESDDSSDDQSSNLTSAEETMQIAEAGTWQITRFIDSGDDETGDFSGFEFSFNPDGTLVAVKGSLTVDGVWSVDDDDSNSSSDDDGNSSDDDDFNIFFNVPQTNDFEDLNDDWDIVSISANKMELIDVSGGNGGTDQLTFEKL